MSGTWWGRQGDGNEVGKVETGEGKNQKGGQGQNTWATLALVRNWTSLRLGAPGFLTWTAKTEWPAVCSREDGGLSSCVADGRAGAGRGTCSSALDFLSPEQGCLYRHPGWFLS